MVITLIILLDIKLNLSYYASIMLDAFKDLYVYVQNCTGMVGLGLVCVCVCVYVHARVCVCVCVHVCMHVCVHACIQKSVCMSVWSKHNNIYN